MTTPLLSRRAFGGAALATAAAATLGGCADSKSGTSGGKHTGSVQHVTYVAGVQLLPREAYMYVTQDAGYFADEGLVVDIKPGAGTGVNLQQVMAGKAQFAAVDLAGALIEGYGKAAKQPLTGWAAVCAVHQQALACILAMKDQGFTGRPSELEGKKIGYMPGGINYLLYPAYAKLAGFSATTTHWVNLAPQNLMPSLAAGTVDAITEFVVSAGTASSIAHGRPVAVFPYSDYFTDLFGNVIATSQKYANSNPDTVRAFTRAMLRGLADTITDPVAAGKAFNKHQPQISADVATAEIKLMIPYTSLGSVPLGTLDDARVMKVIALLQSVGLLRDISLRPQDVLRTDLLATV